MRFFRKPMAMDGEMQPMTATAEELFERGEEAYRDQNLGAAFCLYLQAAEMGYPKAMRKVGQTYLHKGRGVDFDIQQSAYWLQKAAENGDAKAMAQTSWFYMSGIGAPQSDDMAKQWMQKAIDLGDEETAAIMRRDLDDYENKKLTVTVLLESAIEFGGILG